LRSGGALAPPLLSFLNQQAPALTGLSVASREKTFSILADAIDLFPTGSQSRQPRAR
jgi:hypothetical protein